MNENFIFWKFIKRVRARMVIQNKNWLAIICGETGSGKSYSALSLGKLIGGEVFTVFYPKQFLELLNSGRLSKGDVIIFDEAGVGMSSREWYSIQNKLLGAVLQTFRNLNVAVIFTTPNLSFIDVQARKLFHCYFETSYLDYDAEEAHLKVYDIQVNSRFDKTYYKRPVFQDEEERIITMSHLILDKPPEDIVNRYEAVKTEYTKSIYKKALEGLSPPPDKQSKQVNIEDINKQVLKNKDKYSREYNKRRFVDAAMIRNEFDLTIPQARAVKQAVEDRIMRHTHEGGS